MENGRLQTSESLRVGLALAAVGGFLDAYTYLCRGGVFANAETGNMVLLGVNLARGDLAGAARYLPPILAFALGIVAANAIRRRAEERPGRFHWRQAALALEGLVLLAAVFAPFGGGWDMAVNWAVSFVCALQVQAFRKVHGRATATTMCTGNLRSGTDLLSQYFRTKEPELLRAALRYYGVDLVFIAGAAVSALASPALGAAAPLVPCVGLLAVLAALSRAEVGPRAA